MFQRFSHPVSDALGPKIPSRLISAKGSTFSSGLPVHQAIQVAKGRGEKTADAIAAEAAAELTAIRESGKKTADEIAVEIFLPLHKNQVSKAMVAEQLAAIIEALPDTPEEFRGKLPAYLVSAINHVTGGEPGDETQSGASASVAQAAQ